MSIDNAPPGKREKAAARRVRALELRKQGLSYRRIGAALGVSGKTAFTDVMDALADLAELQRGKAEDVLKLELERLDDLLFSMYAQAKRGDQGAVDRILRIMDRRSRYLGLDAPQKIAPTDPTGEKPYEQLSEQERTERIMALLEQARTRRDRGRDPGAEDGTRGGRGQK